jgi:hypothetical protein
VHKIQGGAQFHVQNPLPRFWRRGRIGALIPTKWGRSDPGSGLPQPVHPAEERIDIPISYDGMIFDEGLRLANWQKTWLSNQF